jgi:uncharacterized protein YabE (DUF348 family)
MLLDPRMRASYSIEAILLAACFFLLISLFAGVYAQMAEAEKGISTRVDMESDAELLASRINTLYYTGQGGQYIIERRSEAAISYADGYLILASGNTTARRSVSVEVEANGQGKQVKIEYIGGKAMLTSQ